VKKQQAILISGGILLVLALFIFGKTVPPKSVEIKPPANTEKSISAFDVSSALVAAKDKLPPSRQAYINSLESAVVRGDVKNQQIHVYHQLASFWKDSVPTFEPYAFYTAEASKLENSEKSLTFAAQLFLDNLRGMTDPATKTWMAGQTKDLFERALKINPSNDSAKIGIGSAYIFGSPAENPQELMQGIQKILEVARRDSTNMYAQLMLGIGGVVSGQFDKAIERLLKVISFEPGNMEAMLTLAEAYERKGDKPDAVKWYETSKKFIGNPEVLKEIDKRIQLLK
jgi:tetratricopeptide (TPR) repeat protein